MTDILLFIQNGWKNIWKLSIIWLFSALSIFNPSLILAQTTQSSNSFGSLLSLAGGFIYIILFLISFIGVPYIAYHFSLGRSVTIQETLLAIRKFSGRVIGCSCLTFLLISPIISLVVVISNSTQPFRYFDNISFLFLLFSLFSAVWYFSLFEFFANNVGIRQSVKTAWVLFTAHFRILAALGIIMAIISKIYLIASAILTILIQSGLDIRSISNLNYVNPSASLSQNLLYTTISGVFGIIMNAFTPSAFVLAYFQYIKTKTPSFSTHK
jgi:hypothetical protein